MCLQVYWIIVVVLLCGCFSVISMHSISLMTKRASLTAQLVKNLRAMQETSVQFLGQEDMLEKR